MPETPQVENPNVLTLDYADNPDLKEVFQMKDVGHKCTIKFEVQVMSKYPEGVKLAIEKVITSGYGQNQDKDKEVKPEIDHPVMATVQSRRRKNRGMMGPHGRPPQTVENSAEPSMTSYA